ncbi:MAG: DNA repair protein RadA, partial [Caldisericaceae bacterium]|nr:DNA repair protein RadA [Caldisericaceae bacterium]
DLGICMALVSSMDEHPLPRDAVFVGEVGLNAELRPVNQIIERAREADKLGFKKIVIPESKQQIHLKLNCKIEKHRKLQDLLEEV